MRNHFEWTPEKVEFLRANYRLIGRSEIARRWGVKPIVIGRKAHYLGISETMNRGPTGHNVERWFNWTPDRLRQLKEEYTQRTAQEFADMWGMTAAAVHQRAYRLGLTSKENIGRPGKARRPSQKAFTSPAKVAQALVGKRGDSLAIVETVSARTAKPKQCAWIEYGNRGHLGNRCSEIAVPGRAWCPDCQAKVDALRSEEAA